MARGRAGRRYDGRGCPSGEETISVKLRYRGDLYQIENGHWRGRDGHMVHFLTWVTDDLRHRGELSPRGSGSDLEAARSVAARLGSDACVEQEPDPGET
jgi:hypothetical protein